MHGVQRTIRLLVLAGALAIACAETQPDALLAGHYVWGAEVSTFRPCSARHVYWVVAPDLLQGQLESEYDGLTTQPYEPVFVRLTGDIGPVPDDLRDGFPGDYDGLITVHTITEIRKAEARDCGIMGDKNTREP